MAVGTPSVSQATNLIDTTYGTNKIHNVYINALVNDGAWRWDQKKTGGVVHWYIEKGAWADTQYASVREAVQEALDAWSNVCDVKFEAATSWEKAEIVIHQTATANIGGFAGLSGIPSDLPEARKDYIYGVTIDPTEAEKVVIGRVGQVHTYFANDGLEGGTNKQPIFRSDGKITSNGFQLVLHELGHALGLEHPHDGVKPLGESLNSFPGVNGYDQNLVPMYTVDKAGNRVANIAQDGGDNNLNSTMYTVMSYQHRNGPFGEPTTATPMAFDIAAMQALYRVNTTYHAGNDVYSLDNSSWTCVWDPSGTDDEFKYTGDWNAVIDLRAATLDNTPTGGGMMSYIYKDVIVGNFGGGEQSFRTYKYGGTIANGVVIENATSGSGNDILIGNDAANILNGGAGADEMTGGKGSDTYYVDDFGDKVKEDVDGGTDTVKVSRAYHELAANVENLEYIGPRTVGFTGKGNALVNTIRGADGNDTLDGGAGIDKLYGGLGDDIYYIDNEQDFLSEIVWTTGKFNILVDAGSTDEVRTSASRYTLTEDFAQYGEFENLTYVGAGTGSFTGTGNSLNNVIKGGAGKDTLNGGLGADTLDGGKGADKMFGGEGNDIYYVDDAGDMVSELLMSRSGDSTGWDQGGADEIRATLATYMLPTGYEDPMGFSAYFGTFENLTFVGIGGFTGYGNALDNVIKGGSSRDTLIGLGGDDTLIGGGDADTFRFANGFGQDTISDFVVGTDKLDIKGMAGVNLWKQITVADSDKGAKITFANSTDSITLTGVKASSVTEKAFDFTSVVTGTKVGGIRTTQTFDSYGKESWTDYTLFHDSQGRQVKKTVNYDNGTNSVQEWDVANTINWSEYLKNYDAQGRLINHTVVYDNGTRDVRTWDVDKKANWSDYTMSYDALGRTTGKTTIYDTGARSKQQWDVTNTYNWSEDLKNYDAQDRLINQTVVYDNGTRNVRTWDVDNKANWADYTLIYDAQGRTTGKTTLYDTGASSKQQWDVTNTYNWSEDLKNYDAQGRLINQTVVYDNGTRNVRTWDVDNKVNWADYVNSYDTQNRLSNQTVTYDNGNRGARTWDVDQKFNWADYVNNYDAQGRLINKTVAYDNGTRVDSVWDVNNSANWSDYVNSYDAQGRLLNKTVDYDNGTHAVSQWDVANTSNWSSMVTNYDAEWKVISQSGVYDNGTLWSL